MTFPLPLTQLLGQGGAYIIYLLIGFAFGYILEIAGFGKSTKLAAQFYFRELTVLKVMFSAIVVAMLLIFLASGVGLLDYNLIWVNPTYLWPGIVGGLLMGVGFIVGGFCPGTSLVSAATLKIDGIVFALGVFFGIFLFGETVGLYEDFWYSSYMGRFTLPELFNTETGVVVLAVVLMALAAFGAGEIAERVIGKMDTSRFPRWRYGAAGVGVTLGIAVLFVGQPTSADRWKLIETTQQARLDAREVQAHPVEVLSYMHDRHVITYLIDVRGETDFNQFHLLDAHQIPLGDLPAAMPEFHLQPDNTIFVVMSNDEADATEAWRVLTAESVPNVYILAGGVNYWLDTFSDSEFKAEYRRPQHVYDQPAYQFSAVLGSRYPAANPNPDVFQLEYTPRIILANKRGATSGGCG